MTSRQTDTAGFSDLAVAEAIAPGWERQREAIERAVAPLRTWMVHELAPTPGQTLLELAAGAGDTGFEAAAHLGGDGRLISTDFAPAMVEVARRRGAELAMTGVEYRVLDATAMDLEDDSVDGVVCRMGYMLMSDPPRALAETRRVLRPGSRVVLGVWGPPEGNPYFTTVAMPLIRAGHIPPPDPAEPGIFHMAPPGRTQQMLEAAGFTTVRVEEVPVTFTVADVDAYLEMVADTAGPLAMVLRGLDDDARRELRAQVETAVEPFGAAEGIVMPGLALAAVAR